MHFYHEEVLLINLAYEIPFAHDKTKEIVNQTCSFRYELIIELVYNGTEKIRVFIIIAS